MSDATAPQRKARIGPMRRCMWPSSWTATGAGRGAWPPRAEGHRRRCRALRRVVRAANELGILYLTIFSFSSENWSRPASEIATSLDCCAVSSATIWRTLHRDGVRVASSANGPGWSRTSARC